MIEYTLFWLLSFALGYLLITSVLFIRNRFDLTPLVEAESSLSEPLKISVCIPARNEEKTLPILLNSLFDQKYQNYNIHVLDDHSEDNTAEILKSLHAQHKEKLFIHHGKEKPRNWHGKPWACQQLGELADGDLLVFLDADTTLMPDTLLRIKSSFVQYNLDMLTVWPQQILKSFWEKTLIPLIYYGLITILPTIYVYRKPRWLPNFLSPYFSSKFAAANGQCIAFRKTAYSKIGGHTSVKKEIVEDVALAKTIKKYGLTMRMFHGVGTVSCRMYESHKEIFNGLRKNFLAGFGNSLPLFFFAALIHLIVFLLPYFTLIWAIFTNDPILFFLSVACITITLFHRFILSLWFRWNPVYSFLHPLAVLWFQWLGTIKIVDFLTGKKVSWKGRKV